MTRRPYRLLLITAVINRKLRRQSREASFAKLGERAMTQPIPEAIQAEHLTATLRRAGVLGEAHVNSVTVESSRDTILSRIVRVALTYNVPTGDAPRSLIFKTCHPDRVGDALHAGRQEVAFYDQIAPLMVTNIVPRCFEAYRDAATSAWHLLLED